MVTRTKATLFFLGVLFFVVGLCSAIFQLGNNCFVKFQDSIRIELFFIPVLAFAGLFLILSRSVFMHSREVINGGKKKCCFSFISLLICIALSVLAVYVMWKDFGFMGELAGAGYLILIFGAFVLILLINNVMWLIVFFKSFSKKRVHDESQNGQ